MKVITLFGTRPEIIRLSRVIDCLDLFCEQVLVHTGQNFDARLSDVFFQDLRIRHPDHHLGVRASSFTEQAAQIIQRSGELFEEIQPDRILLLGDTNSGLAAIAAARLGIPVFHMEAGNRCYDDRVPEEINRRIIDHCSTILMPYTSRSMENLRREGIERDRIYVIGNPIYEVLQFFKEQIDSSSIHRRFDAQKGGYFLATLHRAENVDSPERLAQLFEGLARAAKEYSIPMLITVHPRTADRLRSFGLDEVRGRLHLLEPLGLFDFVALEKHARAVISDSGTVQEECAIFRIPNVTIRDVTERAETIECGSNILAGASPTTLLTALKIVLETSSAWTPPDEYLAPEVSRTVAKIVLGYLGPVGRVRMSGLAAQ